MMHFDDFFNDIEKQFQNGLPFVAYRKPNDVILKGLLQTDATLHHSIDFSETGFVFAPFDDRERSILIPLSNSDVVQCEFEVLDNVLSATEKGEVNNPDKQFHMVLVQNAIASIQKKEFQKVVLSRREIIQRENDNPIEIFKRLLHTYATAFVYCFFHPKVGLWLGATPETLLQLEGSRLTTMALAGTQKFEGTTEVIWQNKEKEEQQFVTDYIMESLQSSVSSLQSSETETIRAGNLLHLKTTINANLKPQISSLKTIIKALHPTPAVCGLPKGNAKQFILKNEQYNREFYTGFLGELNFKEKSSRNSNRRNVENNAYASVKTVSNLYVNLRCMQLKDNEIVIYVGGGITKDSIPENEWEETVSKAQVIKSVL